MKDLLKTVSTRSFWRHALFSKDALVRVFGTGFGIYGVAELLDFFSIYTRDKYGKWAFPVFLLISVIYVVFNRRPVKRICFKSPKKDFAIDVVIGDLFKMENTDVVISSNTTFDTAMSTGLISPDSLQGQFTVKFFQTNTAEIDRQLDQQLVGVPSIPSSSPGKPNAYPIGTTATVKSHGINFYFTAMAKLNSSGTAKTDIRDVEDALESLWEYVRNNGQLKNLAIPIMGTGRGRIAISRKKVIERIAQSFADATSRGVFAPKLIIVIRPEDAEVHEINLYQIREYLFSQPARLMTGLFPPKSFASDRGNPSHFFGIYLILLINISLTKAKAIDFRPLCRVAIGRRLKYLYM